MWSCVAIRRKRGQVDTDTDIVVSMLHRRSNLHISCGAKFGCDFLLYDGRRDERHAFAGLRIIERDSALQLPLPTTYDLTGYVRCLNTAGKLALVATVEHDEAGEHVAIVDLALEKILPQNKRKRSRQDAAKNLAKHR
jgi:tRNA splicing endonuclease